MSRSARGAVSFDLPVLRCCAYVILHFCHDKVYDTIMPYRHDALPPPPLNTVGDFFSFFFFFAVLFRRQAEFSRRIRRVR